MIEANNLAEAVTAKQEAQRWLNALWDTDDVFTVSPATQEEINDLKWAGDVADLIESASRPRTSGPRN